MSNLKTTISWTDVTWSPIRGCSRVSEGCRNCYAERMAARFCGPGQPYEGLAHRIGGEARWTGRVELVRERLDDPLRWRKPRKVFVNSMSDLFHEALPDEAIDRVFAVMALAHQHTFQVLTKRAERMRDWFAGSDMYSRVLRWADVIRAELPGRALPRRVGVSNPALHPLRNVWLGVSVEDQPTADGRVPLLLQTPAAVRWVSYEPALGPVDFRPWLHRVGLHMDGTHDTERLDWIVVGGESGPGARPFDLAWARSTVAQCRKAGVTVFVKQCGSWPYSTPLCGPGVSAYLNRCALGIHDSHGGDPSEWPEDLRVREFPR